MTRITAFIDSYRTTFARLERDPLLDLFAFPLQVVSVLDSGPTVASFDRSQWPALLDGLLGAYRTLAISEARPLDLQVLELDGAASVRVNWDLRRDDASSVYEFTALYTVIDIEGALRIAAVTHDELPKLQAALAP